MPNPAAPLEKAVEEAIAFARRASADHDYQKSEARHDPRAAQYEYTSALRAAAALSVLLAALDADRAPEPSTHALRRVEARP